MPMVPSGHKTLVHYPDGTSKVITLYVRPVEGQIIAHGWEVRNVAAGGDDDAGAPIEYRISVARPATEVPPETAAPSSS
jgi:hypothetical protein